MSTKNLEQQKYNLGFLNGCLKMIAQINDKTNHEYDFYLKKLEGHSSSLQDQLAKQFDSICQSYKLKKIDNPKEYLIETLVSWFFEFQEKEFHNIALIDKGNDFSLSNPHHKRQQLEEFVELLLYTVLSSEVYKLEIGDTKEFYVCSSSEIIFVNKQETYHLHLSVSD